MLKQFIVVCLILTLPLVSYAATIQLPRTGQTTCYDTLGAEISCSGTGQDGDIQAGATWPTPRFTDNGNGTVSDNLTGLIWLKNASCLGTQWWTYALAVANTLASGGACDLTDGSVAGDWRLPNIIELESLLDEGNFSPPLTSGHPFVAVQANYYWSSSSRANSAWILSMSDGTRTFNPKTKSFYVWPVRDGL